MVPLFIFIGFFSINLFFNTTFASLNISTPLLEVNVLKQIYELDNGNFWNWPINQSGNKWEFEGSNNRDPCLSDWYGVECQIDKSKNVSNIISINLTNYNLSGPIVPSIQLISKIQTLIFAMNHLTGMVPQEIFNISSLHELDFSFNKLGGPIPENIYELKNITIINLSSNMFNGTLPARIGDLPNLTDLSLQNNRFSGSIPPSIGSLNNLQYMSISLNNLSGSIPPSMGSLINLIDLELHDNQLDGAIPESLVGLVKIENLRLFSNFFSGKIPSFIGNLTTLKRLYLNENLFSGKIPETLGNLPNLIQLYLNSNLLTGSIPSSLGSLVSLQGLFLYSNTLTGSIPPSLGYLSSLLDMFLFFNKLTGTLSDSLGQLNSLKTLFIYSNLLSGQVPGSFCELRNLYEIFLSFNRFTGPMSCLFYNKTRLEVIQLQSNAFSGNLKDAVIPSYQKDHETHYEATSYPYLLYMDVGNNKITGSIPDELFQSMPGLQTLSLTKNCITGTIPSSICTPINLTTIDLGGLHSSESCKHGYSYDPLHLFKGYALESISGKIPSCVWTMPSLRVLHIPGNGLTGNLHDLNNQNWSGSQLRNITLSHNRLSGTIPLSLQTNQFLFSIDLSFNKLRGHISRMENLTLVVAGAKPVGLQANNTNVNLEVNRLTGEIPNAFHEAKEINILNGNVFSCSYYQQNMPRNDPTQVNYQCGSKSLDNSLIGIGASALLFLLIGLLFYILSRRLEWVKELITHIFSGMMFVVRFSIWNWGISISKFNPNIYYINNDDVKYTNYVYFQRSINLIRFVSIIVSAYALLLCMPVYVLFYQFDSQAYSTHDEQYSWKTTSVFLTGDLPAAVLCVLWVSILFASVVLVLIMYELENSSPEKQKKKLKEKEMHRATSGKLDEDEESSLNSSSSSSHPQQRASFSTYLDSARLLLTRNMKKRKNLLILSFLFVVGINTSINLLVNILFVSYSTGNNTNATVTLVLQICMSLFKLLWNVIVMKKLMKLLPHVSFTINLLLGMLVFNMIVAPAVASSLFDSQCFETLIFGSSSISTYFSYIECVLFNTDETCAVKVNVSYSNSFQPGFIYFYSCASALLKSYIPVYILSALVMIAIYPLVTLLFAFLDKKYLPSVVYDLIPALIRPQDYLSDIKPVDSYEMFSIQFILMMNLILMFSFGLVSPPLGVLLMLGIVLNSYVWQYLIERYIYFEDKTSLYNPNSSRQVNTLSAKFLSLFSPLSKSFFENKPPMSVGEDVEMSSICLNGPNIISSKESEFGTEVMAPKQQRPVSENEPFSNGFESTVSESVSITAGRIKILDLACKQAWKFLKKSLYLISVCSLLIYGFIFFDMSGDNGSFMHAIWVPILIFILIAFFIVFIRFFINRFYGRLFH